MNIAAIVDFHQFLSDGNNLGKSNFLTVNKDKTSDKYYIRDILTSTQRFEAEMPYFSIESISTLDASRPLSRCRIILEKHIWV